MARKSWKSIARKVFGKEAVHHEGDGQYAYVTSCGELHYSLWRRMDDVQAIKRRVDRGGCGGACTRKHYILDLAEKQI